MNEDLANQITSSFSFGRNIPYEHVNMFQNLSWPKATTLLNINVNVPRKSMKSILLLFKNDSSDSEPFVYPSLKTVKISIEGKPNHVYSRDLTKNRMYDEGHKLFSDKMKFDQNI